ncbi:Lrp/AsnC family transcriptional regulator [uncultured Microbacterium sp.]|uniref:Lrp/AsnC family transcriptional regulator n=1 Tax=uncultured Microbacterium sp. TaxID=191216 RepID=UPI0025D01EB6|nr:Lrp/AsnC family transcriptional regulator [uncultured Microbacterium sp.]
MSETEASAPLPDAPIETVDDPIDLAIVRAVSRGARATLAQLSEAVGLSVSAVQSRLRKLEARGVITGYRAMLSPEALGRPLAAFIEISPLDPAQPDDAPERLAHLPQIEACHSIAGAASYMLLVRVPTPRDLETLLREIRMAANVNTRTTIVLQTFFENRPLAL